ncbi:MAG: chromosome segregation protein SMC [Syntrophomonadaceae bacterium]
MFLKRLDIKGFKTFADNTEIMLGPGINIIVGPNGCGKSNIVDAVRWVLGEINIRHLRGQKGEDVIFHGSDRKKSQGMAFVELTLDNAHKKLPLDFSEITLGRKVFRDGESEFYLNKSRVRMKDINSLFTGTGVGKRGYSIISQGELEQVLNGHPMDRRLMLEEASGIIRHRQKRDEVKQRIQSSANDILRLNDILSELKTRKEELSRKAEKATVYKGLSSRLEVKERNLMQGEIARIQAYLEPQRQHWQDEQEALVVLHQDIGARETALQQEEEGLQETMQAYKEVRENKHQGESQVAGLQTEIRLAQERIQNCRERQDDAREDAVKYNDMLKNLNSDLDERLRDLEQEQLGYQSRLMEKKELQDSINEGEQHLDEIRTEFEETRSTIFEKVQAESELKNTINRQEDILRRAEERKERLAVTASELVLRIKSCSEKGEELQGRKVELGKELVKNNDWLTKMEEQRRDGALAIQKLDEDFRKREEETGRCQSRLASIRDMDRDLVGYSQAAKQIIQAGRDNRLRGIRGLVGEIIKVPAGLETAIDTAIGRGLENVIVDKADQAREAIDWLKAKKAGRLTFIPLDILRVQKVPQAVRENWAGYKGVLGLASELVEYADTYARAVEYLLGRVLVVENLDQAVRLFKGLKYPLRIVSLDGESINLAGAISGGARTTQTNSPLQRKGEERKLVQLLEEYQSAGKLNREQRQEQGRLLGELDGQILELKGQCLECRLQYEMTEKQLDDLNIEKENLENEHLRTLRGSTELKQEITDLASELETLQGQAQAVREESKDMDGLLEGLRETIERAQREHEVRKERLRSLEQQLSMKERELESAKNNFRQFEQVRDSYQQSAQEAANLIQGLEAEVLRESRRQEELEGSLQENFAGLNTINIRLQGLEEEDKKQRSRLSRARRELGPIKQELAERESRLREVEIDVARAETELDAARRRWWERFSCQPPSVSDIIPDPVDLKNWELMIEELKQEIEVLGPVDLESIQEYAEASARCDFLEAQYEDLCTGRDSLQALLKETEKLMDREFAGFFVLANESFKQTFVDIFGGGEASLHIENGADRLESGVNIEVKIPGKRIQALNLLSGGEKALTCIAFVFSLLRLKPVPFCILDEIDASLDDSNLIKFTDFVKTMAGDIQFIMITHRQATIESGEKIYGITMPEKGVSSVLTLNLREAAELAG